MPITISTKTYTLDTQPTPDSAKYVGPAQTATVKDFCLLKRTAPKPAKGFNGMVRCTEKTVKSVVVDGVTRDLIGNTEYSYPVGALPADVTALRTDHVSLVSNAAVSQPLVDNSKITY